ncbi:MAG: SdpI family protein [Clostridia bacterium]|nr:SdpI family protein [Clostridia bacterium]
MIKKNKVKLALASLVTLLPLLLGVLFWNKLPETLAMHWGVDGAPDGWGSRTLAVVGMPLILLALLWLCVIVTAKDPKNKGQNQKAFGLVIWIVPVLSLFAGGMIYSVAFGYKPPMERAVALLMGVLFLAIGNYLPKCKQNHTIGIKIKWTLQSEENWNATHRIGGKVWVIGGVVLLACCFLPKAFLSWALLIVMVPLVVFPFIYSYRFYKTH